MQWLLISSKPMRMICAGSMSAVHSGQIAFSDARTFSRIGDPVTVQVARNSYSKMRRGNPEADVEAPLFRA